MSTTKEFAEYIMDQLSGIEGISSRKMMGEYVLYHNGRVFGGIYDNRLLIKPTDEAFSFFENAPMELPYDGAKPMIRIFDTENREFLEMIIPAVSEQIAPPKKRTKKNP